MEVSVLGFPTRRFTWGPRLLGFGAPIKTARGKVASTKQFIIGKIQSQIKVGEQAGSPEVEGPLGCFLIGYYLVSLGCEAL